MNTNRPAPTKTAANPTPEAVCVALTDLGDGWGELNIVTKRGSLRPLKDGWLGNHDLAHLRARASRMVDDLGSCSHFYDLTS